MLASQSNGNRDSSLKYHYTIMLNIVYSRVAYHPYAMHYPQSYMGTEIKTHFKANGV